MTSEDLTPIAFSTTYNFMDVPLVFFVLYQYASLLLYIQG
jgi:hypothetical protein